MVFHLLLACCIASPILAATPPVPSQPTATCDATVGGTCYVNGPFTLSTSSAGAHHFAVCRSNDSSGWGGCDVVMSSNTGSSYSVSGSHLPSNGLRRAYYFKACDSANSCTSWGSNPETYVHMDSSPPSAPGNTAVSCAYSTGDVCWVTGNFTVGVAPANDSGSGVSVYKVCRSNDVTGWGGCDVSLTTNAGTYYSITGSHLPADGYRRAYYFKAKDRVGNWGGYNTPRYVKVDRHAPTVSASGSSTTWFASRTATITAADVTGGASANSGLQRVRYSWNTALNAACSNGTAISSGAMLTAPAGDNTLNLCARDLTGRVSTWSGTYRVDTTPPSAPGPTTVSCAYSESDVCWVTGDFTASVTAATDASGIAGYKVCRSNDTSGWGGCNVTLTNNAGSSHAVPASHLPADGLRRAFYFKARDNAGNWGAWNAPRYIKVDRHPPSISASGASSVWHTSRTATITASDVTAGAEANSGLALVRYRWNLALGANCTGGIVTSSGTTLTAPGGENTLYLCARDQAGRVTAWNGTYRVDTTAPTRDALTVSSSEWSVGDGSTYRITAKVTDNGVGVRELRTLINFAGDNSANPRGNFSWRDESLGYHWTADQVPCTGGGYASKRPDAFNPDTVTLVGCETTLSGNQRTVTFTVLPHASFGAFPANDISFFTRDLLLNATNWQNYDLNFSSVVNQLPPRLRIAEVDRPPLHHEGDVEWGTVDQDSGGFIDKPMIVHNNADADAADLILEGSPSNLEIVGAGSAAFSIVGSLASPIAAEESDEFTLRLSTTEVGTFNAVLLVHHNDPTRHQPVRINLSGTVGNTNPPEITSITPWKIAPGVRTVRIRGERFEGATVMIGTEKLEPEHPNRVFPVITDYSVSSDGTEITATVDASASGVDGIYNVIVETECDGCVSGVDLRVVPANTPVVDMYTPSEVSAGRIFPMVLTGANLQGSSVSASHPDVVVLDVDSSDDELISGVLAVPVGVDPGSFDVDIQTASGLVVSVPVAFVAAGQETKQNQAVVSEEKLAEARALGQEIPGVYIQEPTVSPSLLARIQTGEESPEKILGCLITLSRRLINFTRVYVIPIDAIGEIDPRVLHAVGLGSLTRFGALTISFFADVTLQFSFDICRFTDFGICIFARFGAEVVGFGGVVTTFNFCFSFGGGFSAEATTGGELSRVEMSSPGLCTEVTQVTDPFGGGTSFANGARGAHYADLLLTSCCEEEVTVDVTLSTFVGEPFFGLVGATGSGPLATATPNAASCPTAGLTLFLDANQDNDFASARFVASSPSSKALAIDLLTDIDKYLPCTDPTTGQSIPVGQSQTMTVVAAYTTTSGNQVTIVPPPSGVTEVTFTLDNTSNFTGQAMNWPPQSQNPSSDPDFSLPSAQVQVLFNANHIAPVQLECHDYGGYTTVKATPNGPSPQTEELTIPIPQTNPLPGAPPLPKRSWTTSPSMPVDTLVVKAMDDKDDMPAVNAAGGLGNTEGDNLTAYAEYRGFVVNGQHKRLSPSKKDVFVRNQLPASRGIGGADQLGLEFHFVREDEFLKVPTPAEVRIIAFNGYQVIPETQSVIRLREDVGTVPSGATGTYTMGETSGSLAENNETPNVAMFLNVVQARAQHQNVKNPRFTENNLYRWVLSHEIGHAVDICHRMENAQGQAVDEHSPTLAVLPDQNHCPVEGGDLIPKSKLPNQVFFMHSGYAIDKVSTDDQFSTVVGAYHPNSLNQIRVNP